MDLNNVMSPMVFRHVEPNYVVGIRDLWTLQSACVWEDTHFVALVAFATVDNAGRHRSCVLRAVGSVVGFFCLWVCSASPWRFPSCILISFKRSSTTTLLGDLHQLVSFVANKTNLMYNERTSIMRSW